MSLRFNRVTVGESHEDPIGFIDSIRNTPLIKLRAASQATGCYARTGRLPSAALGALRATSFSGNGRSDVIRPVQGVGLALPDDISALSFSSSASTALAERSEFSSF